MSIVLVVKIYSHVSRPHAILHYTLQYAQRYCTPSLLDVPLSFARIVLQSSPRPCIRFVARQVEREARKRL
jgi:hypothetical protein